MSLARGCANTNVGLYRRYMKKCRGCGFDNDDSAQYCSDCGHVLVETSGRTFPLPPASPSRKLPMAHHRQVVKRLAFSGFIGWAGLQTALAIDVFLLPHAAGFAAEAGRLEGFIYFGMLFTLCYVASFVFLAIPSYFFFRPKLPHIPLFARAFCGAALFICSVPVWSVLGSVWLQVSRGDMRTFTALAAIAGLSSFSVLTPSIRMLASTHISLTRKLFLYCAAGAVIWYLAETGATLFCYFGDGLISKCIYLPFFWLARWPNYLLQPCFPK
jgi:hypothetical protein